VGGSPDAQAQAFGPRYQAAPHLDASPRHGPRPGLDSVRRWNQITIDASGFDHANAREQLGPCRASRAMAIVHIAMFDTINAVVGEYQSYTGVRAPTGALSMQAAISQAAHDTLAALFPAQAASFDAWLAEDGWPDGHMDIAMLEGYLVALIAWPIELSPGAWLPAIWGIRGWKVAAKIATPDGFSKFIALIIGYVQELERRLTEPSSSRTFVLARQQPLKSCQHFAGAQWSAGFLTALQETSSGYSSRSVTVRGAVETIARFGSLRSSAPSSMPQVPSDLHSCLMTIVNERPSAGIFTTGKPVPAKIPGLKPQARSHSRKPTTVSLPYFNSSREPFI